MCGGLGAEDMMKAFRPQFAPMELYSLQWDWLSVQGSSVVDRSANSWIELDGVS